MYQNQTGAWVRGARRVGEPSGATGAARIKSHALGSHLVQRHAAPSNTYGVLISTPHVLGESRATAARIANLHRYRPSATISIATSTCGEFNSTASQPGASQDRNR